MYWNGLIHATAADCRLLPQRALEGVCDGAVADRCCLPACSAAAGTGKQS